MTLAYAIPHTVLLLCDFLALSEWKLSFICVSQVITLSQSQIIRASQKSLNFWCTLVVWTLGKLWTEAYSTAATVVSLRGLKPFAPWPISKHVNVNMCRLGHVSVSITCLCFSQISLFWQIEICIVLLMCVTVCQHHIWTERYFKCWVFLHLTCWHYYFNTLIHSCVFNLFHLQRYESCY